VSSSRLAATLLALFALAAAAPAAASAGTVTKTVPAQYVFVHGQNPADPGNCSAIVFAQWTDVPGTISALARYTGLVDAAWGEQTESRPAPFDDTYKWVATYTVPAGSHWIQIGKGWRDGPGVDDCADMSAKQPALYRAPVNVDLTIQESAGCVSAHRKADKATASIATLQKKLKQASRRRRAAVKKQLSSAKRDLKKAQKDVTTRCP